MRKRIQLLLLVSILPLLAIAQTPKRIHDLKSLTDSGQVYIKMDGEVIIGFNSGREFPKFAV